MFDRRLRDGIREMSGVIKRIRSLQRRNECRSLSLMSAMAVNSGTRATLGGCACVAHAAPAIRKSRRQRNGLLEARCLSVSFAPP
jgi:hypothetical protein